MNTETLAWAIQLPDGTILLGSISNDREELEKEFIAEAFDCELNGARIVQINIRLSSVQD